MDPLHLPGSGLAGIPGLVHAAASGSVTLINRPGSGVINNHALGAFAAKLFPRVLGEAQLLPDITTIWLGEPDNRKAVLGSPERWAAVEAIARNDPGEPSPMLGPGTLTPSARRTLEDRLASEGHRWVGVEPVALATTPLFDGTRLVPEPFALRTYVVVGDNGYQILPGGLVRLAGGPTAAMLPNGHGSKDLWITATRPERPGRACCGRRCARCTCAGRVAICSAEPPTTCTGSGVTASAPKAACGSCAACCRGSSRMAVPTATRLLQRLLRLQLEPRPAMHEERRGLAGWDAVEQLVRAPDVRPRGLRPAGQPRPAASHRRPWSATRSAMTPGGCSTRCTSTGDGASPGAPASPGRCSSCSTTASGR